MSVFAPSGPAPLSTVSIQGAQSPTITNTTLILAATEYTITVPALAKGFLLKTRAGASLQLAYLAGNSATTYITVPRYCWYGETEISVGVGGLNIYVQSPTAGEVVELLYWS